MSDLQNIFVEVFNDTEVFLSFGNMKVQADIGKEGVTKDKKEGDYKTPLGTFKLGLAMGTHKKEEVQTELEYIQITENHYWVDDPTSRYYNQLVDIRCVQKDWNSAEHLIDYAQLQYEYLIELKTNPENIPGKGSAIFLHIKGRNGYTAGCIGINKDEIEKLLHSVTKDTTITIMQREHSYDENTTFNR